MLVQRAMVIPAILACLMPGLSSAHDPGVANGDQTHWIRDSAITAAVTARLAEQHFSQLTRLKVKTEMGGVVSLGGNASRSEAARAVAIARGIGGVLRVNNDIVIQRDTH